MPSIDRAQVSSKPRICDECGDRIWPGMTYLSRWVPPMTDGNTR